MGKRIHGTLGEIKVGQCGSTTMLETTERRNCLKKQE